MSPAETWATRAPRALARVGGSSRCTWCSLELSQRVGASNGARSACKTRSAPAPPRAAVRTTHRAVRRADGGSGAVRRLRAGGLAFEGCSSSSSGFG
eukprot:scaffold3418_cov124-Isochrysis_galbana.AAC.26